MDLFAMADKYDVEKLKIVAREKVLKNINEENSFDVFMLGLSHNSNYMKKVAFDFIANSLATNQKFFKAEKLDAKLMNKPKDLKKLIDAFEVCVKKQIEARNNIKEIEMERKRRLEEAKQKKQAAINELDEIFRQLNA
jgi:hypothetical protein